MKNFLRGIAAGIAIGYLTAPRSGKETREQLSDTVNGMKEQWEDAKTQISELIEDVKAQVSKITPDEQSDSVNNRFDAYHHDTTYTRDRAVSRYNDTIDDMGDAANSGIDTAEENLKLGGS